MATDTPTQQDSGEDKRVSVVLPIEGMTCTSCIVRIECALTKVPVS